MTGGTPNLANTGGVDVLISEIQGIVPSNADLWGNSYFEFIELYNPTDVIVNLTGWRLSGFSYEFPEGAQIKPYEFVVVARNPDVYAGEAFDFAGDGDDFADDENHRIQIDHLNKVELDDNGRVTNSDEANLFGPASGNINDLGDDRLRLFKPGLTTDFTVDEVQFASNPYSSTGDGGNGTTIEAIICDAPGSPIDSCTAAGDEVGTMVSFTGELFNIGFNLSNSEDGADAIANQKFSFELVFPDTPRDRNAWVDYKNYDATNWKLSYQWGGSPGFERLEPPGPQCGDVGDEDSDGACNAWYWDDNESLAPESWPLDDINYWPVTINNNLCYYPTTYCDCADAAAAIAESNSYSDDVTCGCCDGVDSGAGQCVGCMDPDADNTNQQPNGDNCKNCSGGDAPCTSEGNNCVYSPVNVSSINLENLGYEQEGSNTVKIKIDFVYDADSKYPVQEFRILRSNDGGNNYLTLTEVDYAAGVTDYTYTDEGVDDDTTYRYKIETLGDGGGDSQESDGLISSPIVIPNYGCMVTYASNYDSEATIDDGSCVLNTCTDINSLIYNELCDDENIPEGYDYNICVDDGTCTYADVEITNLEIRGPSDIIEGQVGEFELLCNDSHVSILPCISGGTLSNTSWSVESAEESYTFSYPDADLLSIGFSAPLLYDTTQYEDQDVGFVYEKLFTVTATFQITPYDPTEGVTELSVNLNFDVQDSPSFGCKDPTSCNYISDPSVYPCNATSDGLGNNESCANYNVY